jgi:signal transduction histidine kinase
MLDPLKTSLLAYFSHEMRTPITIVLQAAESMARGTFGPVTDQQKVWLERMEASASRIELLLRDAMELSRAHTKNKNMVVNRELVEMGQLVKSVVEQVSGLAQQNKLELISDFPREPLWIWAGHTRLEQVIANLLTNAIKFTPAPGRVKIAVSRFRDKCLVEVRDTGPGIQKKDIKKIFKPFVQIGKTMPPGGHNGLGLGLAICKEIIGSYRGKIWVDSTVNKGSRFVFTLPLDARSRDGKAVSAPS